MSGLASLFIKLFPAHAGVILESAAWAVIRGTVPRTRGGDPFSPIYDIAIETCSAHGRG